MTFEKWLVKFKKQDNAIGDLARDFISTGCYTVKESFDKFYPCSSAVKTYKEARRNYIAELSNLIHGELTYILEEAGDLIDEERHEPTDWIKTLDSLHNLHDMLEEIEDKLYKDNEEE